MSTATKNEIPVFPLPGVVLFPNSLLPLHIFEPRYRKMLVDILATNKRFMLLNADADNPDGTFGCIAEVIQVEKLKDGRANILTVGRDRAKVVEYFGNRPYLMARIEIIRDQQKQAAVMSCLSELRVELAQLSRLTKKVYGRDVDELLKAEVSAEDLSFLVAGLLVIDPSEQQRVLEINQTSERIKMLQPKIVSLSKKLAAIAAIEDAFGK